MIANKDNAFCVLPFYDNISEQHANQSFAFGEYFHELFVNKHTLIPFQIQLKSGLNGFDSVYFRNEKNERVTGDVSGQLRDAGLHIVNLATAGLKVVVYPANVPVTLNILEGLHYLEIVFDNDEVVYSEMFTIVNNTDCFIRLEYFDYQNLVTYSGATIYANPPIMPQFKNVLYIKSEIGRPEYPFTEEAKDRDGFVFPEKRLSSKQFKFVFSAPEYLCDALRFVMLADKVWIYEGSKSHEIDKITMTPKFLDRADRASVEVEFTTNTVVKKNGANILARTDGDFNQDFDDDFFNISS